MEHTLEIHIKRIFLDVIAAGTRELTHLDYKRELFCKTNSENDNKKAEVKGYTNVIKHIMGMYNIPNKYGDPFPSVRQQFENSFGSSYIIFGVDYKENKKIILACPIESDDEKRGFIDERNLQEQIRERLNYPVAVNYHEIHITESDMLNSDVPKPSWLKLGCYGMLEIIHDDRIGPILAKSVTDRKPGKGTKNEIANKLYFHKQGTTATIDPTKSADCILENEIMSKFKSNYINYANRFEHLQKCVKSARKSFHILVTTAQANSFQEEQRELLKILSNVKWNIVFDTDKNTAKDGGMYHYFRDKLILPITNILPVDIARLQEDGWKASTIPNEGAHEKSCLYIFTNGDSTVPENETASFQRTDIQSLAKILFQRIHLPIQLFVYVLVFNPSMVKSIEEICKGLDEAWDEVKNPQTKYDEEDTYPNTHFIFISYHESLIYLLAKYLPENETCTSVVAPLQQISDFFCNFQQDHDDSERSELPGSAANVFIKERDVKIMGKYFDLYYSKRGKGPWLALKGKEELKEEYKLDISSKFLQGFHLTPEALYLHECDIKKIYVKRRIMSESIKQVRQVLKRLQLSDGGKTPLHQVEKNIIQIIHEPSAGGTTVGRAVLWEIRNEYPSLILLSLEGNYQEVLDWLHQLYNISQLPLCILIDTSVITNMRLRDVEKFAFEVQAAEVRAAIFFVQQFQEIDQTRVTRGQLILLNKLNDDEEPQFDELMSQAGQLLKKTPSKTITLYGLCQFGRKYKLLQERLNTCKVKGSEQDKILLLLASITYSYSKQPLPFYFVAKMFKINPDRFYNELDEMLDHLHMARDFLIVEDDENVSDNFHSGIRPVTSFVSNEILKFVFGDKKDYLILFINSLISLLEHSNICDQAITAVTKPLFIQRNITEGTKAMFSQFVMDLDSATEIDTTLSALTNFANSVGSISTEEGPHVRSMLARYLAYRKENIDQALIEMRKALKILNTVPFNSTMTNDSTLLTTAGSLINLKLTRIAEHGEGTNEFGKAVELFHDARVILLRAQKSESNSYPFTVEARLWYNYMNLYFCGPCQRNRKDFSRLLETTDDDTLKNAAEEAMKKLSHLECLLQKHEMDGYDEKTEEQIAKIKMKILALKIDIEGTQQCVFENMCMTDPWLARGLVDFYFYNIERRRRHEEVQEKPTFEMLAPPALRNIIAVFEEHISSGLTRSNYRHAILAMIYLYHKCGPRMHQGNIKMAQYFAESWFKWYPDDNRPHYFLALTYLIQAISIKNMSAIRKDFIQKMKDSYRKCKDIVTKRNGYQKSNGYKRHSHELTFILADYDNLHALIPLDTQYDFEKVRSGYKLKIFTGKAKSIERGHILWCDELQSDVTIPYNIYYDWRKYAKERPVYWFILQTRTGGFFVEELFSENPFLM